MGKCFGGPKISEKQFDNFGVNFAWNENFGVTIFIVSGEICFAKEEDKFKTGNFGAIEASEVVEILAGIFGAIEVEWTKGKD